MNDHAWDLAHLSAICDFSDKVDYAIIDHYNPKNKILFKKKMEFFKPFIYLDGLVWSMYYLINPSDALPMSMDIIQKIYNKRLNQIYQKLNSRSYKKLLTKYKRIHQVNLANFYSKYLFDYPTQIPNFRLKTKIVTYFIENKKQEILVLKKSKKED